MNLPKIGDIMIYKKARAEVTEIISGEYNEIRYYCIWSDNNKRQAIEETDFLYDTDVSFVTKEVWNSPLYKIMRENDWLLLNFMLN